MGFLSTTEAAKRLGCTRRRITQLYSAGVLTGQRIGKHVLAIDEKSLKNEWNRRAGWPKGRKRKDLQKS